MSGKLASSMNFTIEATLDTRAPFVIDLLGAPSAVIRDVTGKVRLVVNRPVLIKQISASFLGQAFVNVAVFGQSKLKVKSEPLTIDRIDASLISEPTYYLAGEYTFPFELSIPTDIPATDTSRIPPHSLLLEYYLVATAVPAGLLSRKKEWKRRLEISRVHVEQSSTSNALFGAKRADKIECSMYAPKFLPFGQDSIVLNVFMHAYSQENRVKKIEVKMLQNQWADLRTETHAASRRGRRFLLPTDPSYLITSSWRGQHVDTIVSLFNVLPVSEPFEIENPDNHCSTAWGREDPIEIVLKLLPEMMQPSEVLNWLKLVHVLQFTLHFAEESVRPMVVKTPVVVGKIIDGSWTDHVIWQVDADGQQRMDATEGEETEMQRRLRSELPEYGQEVADTTLLDANTHRVQNAMLFRETYPERGELIVPDVADDQPPVYEREEDIAEQQTVKA
ncbi:hypothetical protein EMPS_09565 [Entomortierella parvispora]|uniref:Uncharacterized protein n=1 Tax=Entomortierella parvispora TaxID=205924 RepID=A0A9P3HIF8_9FUNG|nr:hypothetical protein EMPS_09565 [Entomortierella parvispora]